MSFLQQLKQQANQLQNQRGPEVRQLEASIKATEDACQTIRYYLSDLAAQLNVIEPDARPLSLDGKTRWPAMKLAQFRFDARKKTLHEREVTDYIGMGWMIVPREPVQERGRVSVNFPPDLERVESRLRAGSIKHDRLEQRHPDTGKLQALVFEHDLSSRASAVFKADHDQALLHVRLVGVTGLVVQQTQMPASAITTAYLDDLAKAIVGQPSSLG